MRKEKIQKAKRRAPWPQIRDVAHRTGAKAWLVDARINGKGQRYFFKSKVEAETKTAELRVSRRNEGIAGISIPEKLRVEALDCQARLVTVGASLSDAVDFFLKNVKPVSGTKTCKEVAEELLQRKRKSGKRESYVKALGWAFGVFNRKFGDRKINEVIHPEVEDWLDSKEHELATRRAYIRDVGILFNFAVARGYAALNPVARIEKVTLDESEPGIFTVGEAEALLRSAGELQGSRLIPLLTIGFFAGLRTSEIRALDWSEVDLAQRLIEVKGKKAKTRQRRHVDVSDNLAAWLQPFAKPTGPVIYGRFREALERVVVDARRQLHNVRSAEALKMWPKNGLRHSFASYHLAKHQNQNLTALQMGHADTTMLFAHYRNLVKPKDAERYWQIMPSTDAEH
jgi:integrase